MQNKAGRTPSANTDVFCAKHNIDWTSSSLASGAKLFLDMEIFNIMLLPGDNLK